MKKVSHKLNQNRDWRIVDLIKWSHQYLKSKLIPNSRKESEWFLSHIYKCDRLELYLKFDQIVDEQKLKLFKSFIIRRLNNEPFQYIINRAPFYGRDFYVNENVLIPRPETETIIDIVKNNKVDSILDIGTGSGCLAITLSLEKVARQICAIDKYQNILDIAKANAIKNNCQNISFKKIDIINEIPDKKFNIVISNPPYISKEELKSLDSEILNYEPHNSLTDNSNGLIFYKRFDKIFESIVLPKGKFIVEFGGENQLQGIRKIFNDEKYNLVFHKDLNGSYRVVEIMKDLI